MKKKVIVSLIVAGSIVLVLGGSFGIIAASGTRNVTYSNSHPEYAYWMKDIPDSRKLNDIVMPGSHDAGTYTMSWLGKTHGYSIGDQLKIGCRYFDLRTNNTNDTADGLVIYHSIINGQKFVDVVSDIKEFITVNTSETLILDFQHFKKNAANLTYQYLKEQLGNYIYSKPADSTASDLEHIDALTLGQTRGKCVLFWGEDYQMAEDKLDLFARNNDECTKTGMSMDSEYIGSLHKKSSTKFIEEAMPKYFADIQTKIEKEKHKGMFVLQCQLTDGALLLGPWTRERGHASNMSEYIKKLKDDTTKMSLLNIVMRDFLDNGNPCEEIIELNQYKK